MSDEASSPGASLPAAVLERIDRVCLDFEAVWKEGAAPRIEEYLGKTQGPERSRLLRELLLLELDYRARQGEQPRAEEYEARFAEDRSVIRDAFQYAATDAAGGRATPRTGLPVLKPRPLPSELGDYELLEVLGDGGMGIVYRARQRSADRIVALKVIRPDRLAAVFPQQREEAIERMRAEALAAAKLEHDHIVPVFEVGEVEGEPFFSMRYIEGRRLDEVLRDGPLDGREAAALLEPVARAVHYAHEHGIIHRDLKPRNILLDSDRRPFVADFGLAKSPEAAQHLTQTGQAVGTLPYMSPQQAQGEAAGRAGDVYSLGATLYDLLTGRPPFRAATLAETQRQLIENEPVPPRRLNPAVDRDLETICLKCLEKEPQKRYATAEELADELARYQQGKPIHARPITRLARAWRWCKRNRAVASLGAVSAGLLLALAIGGPIVAVEQASLRRTAENATSQARWAGDRTEEALRRNQILLAELKVSMEEANRQRDKAQKAATLAEEQTARAEAGESRAEAEAEKVRRALEATEEAERKTRRTLYVADMNRIQKYWEIPNIAVVRSLLKRHRPKESEEDLRSFEWYYWWRLCHQERATWKHDGEVQRVAFSPDGKWLAAACAGGVVAVRDPETGKIRHNLKTGDIGFAALAFSADGQTLAAAGAEGKVSMWNVPSGDLLRSFPNPVVFNYESRQSAAFDSNCQRFARSFETGSVRLFNRSDDRSQRVLLDGRVEGVFIYRKETKVAARPTRGIRPPFSKQWNLAHENAPAEKKYGGPAYCMAFSNDGTLLAAGSSEGAVKVWDTQTAKEKALLGGHEGVVWAVAFSEGGETLVSAGEDGQVIWWDLDTATQKAALQAHAGDVYALHLLPGGDMLATAGADGTIKLWDPAGSEPKAVFKGHEGSVNWLASTPDGQTLASGGADGTVRLWPLQSDRASAPFQTPSGMILSVAFSPPDGKLLAVVVRNDPNDPDPFPNTPDPARIFEKLVLWDLQRGEERFHAHLSMPYADAMSAAVFSPDGKKLAVREYLWHGLTSPDQHSWIRAGAGTSVGKMVGPAAFAPNGRIMATAGILEGTVVLWGRGRGGPFMLDQDASFSSRS